MSIKTIPLLVWKDGAKSYLTPQDGGAANVEYRDIPLEQIVEIRATSFGSVLRMENNKEIHVLETPSQIKAAEDPSTSNPHAQHEIAIGLDAAGSAQGAGVAVSKYFNTVDAATDTSAEAIDIAAATANDVKVVVNETAVALEAFPASGENFQGKADDAVLDIPANSKAVLYCLTAGTWEYILLP